VRGRVSGDGDLRLEGNLEGDVALRGDFTIAEGAKATSNVEARAVTVSGELEGDVRAQGAVHLEAGARVRGDIYGDAVSIEEGAEYSGRLAAEFELPPELGGSGGGRRR
jgi:cytoskeletal protein CcmA (bactofilin family)